MPAPLNIILVDDHPLLRLGVAGYINQEEGLTMTAQLANAAELRAWLSAGNKADVALLDRSLPDADGLDLVSEVRDAGIKVIMLTIADSDEEISEAIAAGVDGYVIKSSDPEQVIAAIRSVCDGQSSFPLNVMQKMARGELSSNALAALTAREMEIVEHVKEGLSNKVIAYKLSLSENTVRNHLRNIMEKLGLRNRVQVATLALKEDRKRH
ncbi:MAG: response regulator transcription factor [Thiobacillaceae bacterium]|jgi:DNA-binding NarL/FixJ family response regulator|nr:response regulator transcription factor [Thiobacillaceae bacterium]